MLKKTFPSFRQADQMDCGATCLQMISAYYGKYFSLAKLRELSGISREGASILGLTKAAEAIGFKAIAVEIPLFSDNDFNQIGLLDAPLPSIVFWEQNHFLVVYKIEKNHVYIADPARGKYKISINDFKKKWMGLAENGITLLLEPTTQFFNQTIENEHKKGFKFLIPYIKPYRRLIFQLMIGLVVATVLQLILPFLTQLVVDFGIQNQNIGFIKLMLLAQIMVFVGQTMVQVIQSWILLHIGTRINVSFLSDFLVKMMELPLAFFETKMMGDLLQRIDDHSRVESFLVGTALNFLFSAANLIVFAFVLLIYNFTIFLVFLIGGISFFFWIFYFLNKRRTVDYQRFSEQSEEQNKLIEIIKGMPEIKLQNSQQKHRQQWVTIQSKLFNTNIRALQISQFQEGGALAINQIKDIFISFLAATAVVNGQMTLGMMLAIQFIVGQLNGPLIALIGFFRQAQDAKISLERLSEIHNLPPEQIMNQNVQKVPQSADILIENLNFRYDKNSENILKNLNLIIPFGKTTAIVGKSGSGKTTLLKLLLGFYEPQDGQIKIGQINLKKIDKAEWRKNCGAVLQDGFIFSDSIANNISESEKKPNFEKLESAAKVANIQPFIENLPSKSNTKIGEDGIGISQGQRQRILIARAVYKNPNYLFFDEATNALDSQNENQILNNLKDYFAKKTIVVVAHRLSTVQNADQIIVMDKGEVSEIGNHQTLIENRGIYFRLVKGQLDI